MRPGHRTLKVAHRWLGLSLGLLIALLGLTGSLLVFHREIDHFVLNRDLWRLEAPAPGTSALTLVTLAERVQAQRPNGTGFGADRPAFEGSAPLGFWEESGPDGHVTYMTAALDPATGVIRGSFAWGALPPTRANFTSVIYRLHYELFAGDVGIIVVGFVGIGTMLMIGIGLFLWWPTPGRLKQRLTLKRDASPVRRDYDLHNVSGAWGAVILFVVAVSGTYMVFPDQFKAGIAAVAPVTGDRPPTRPTEGAALPAVEAERAARALFPRARYDSAALGDASGPMNFTFREPGDPRKEHGSTRVEVSRTTGQAVIVARPANWTTADAVMRWQFPLHNGEIFGLAGRILVFICGLLPTVLLWTGLRLWLARRRAHQRVGARRVKGERGALLPAK